MSTGRALRYRTGTQQPTEIELPVWCWYNNQLTGVLNIQRVHVLFILMNSIH